MKLHTSWIVGFLSGLWLAIAIIAVVTQQEQYIEISIFLGAVVVLSNIALICGDEV